MSKIHLMNKTDDYRKAGYIDLDGSLLDFSRGSFKRVMDHREIKLIDSLMVDDKNMNMDNFIRMGAVRVNFNPTFIQLVKTPNRKQIRVICSFVKRSVKSILIDIPDLFHKFYDIGINPHKIISDIKRKAIK